METGLGKRKDKSWAELHEDGSAVVVTLFPCLVSSPVCYVSQVEGGR